MFKFNSPGYALNSEYKLEIKERLTYYKNKAENKLV